MTEKNKKIIICRETTERNEIIGKHGVFCKTPDELLNIFNKVNKDYIINESCPYGYGESYKNIIHIIHSL